MVLLCEAVYVSTYMSRIFLWIQLGMRTWVLSASLVPSVKVAPLWVPWSLPRNLPSFAHSSVSARRVAALPSGLPVEPTCLLLPDYDGFLVSEDCSYAWKRMSCSSWNVIWIRSQEGSSKLPVVYIGGHRSPILMTSSARLHAFWRSKAGLYLCSMVLTG